jgi:hypothetical protein
MQPKCQWFRFLAPLLALLLAMPAAQPLAAAQAGANPRLKIVILEGEGAINNARQRTARDPVVEVRDENDRPIAGAVVTFALPGRGAGGSFANGAQTMTATTNAQGQATATGLQANNAAGEFQIHVTASHEGQTASTTISQTNLAAAAGASAGKVAAILAIVGGAAAGAAVALTRKDESPTPVTQPTQPPTAPPTATITPGAPTVGAPR